MHFVENLISNNFCANTFFSKTHLSQENRKKPTLGAIKSTGEIWEGGTLRTHQNID